MIESELAMNEESEQNPLEQLIAQAAYASEEAMMTAGLKLEILKKARKEARKRTARRQITGLAAACLLIFIITGSHLQTFRQFTPFPSAEPTRILSGLALCQLQLEGADIGTWPHVESVLNCKIRIRAILGTF